MNCLLIGKQNAGKSSIFNILSETKTNIVHNIGGTTRDWHVSKIYELNNINIYDTPGILVNKNYNIFTKNLIFKNLIKKINIFLYVIDYNSIFNDDDYAYINILRKYNKKILLLINKFDNYNSDPNNEFHKYGIKNVFFLSCSHKFGFNKLIEYFKIYKTNKNEIISKHHHSIAVFGKPNVGKSTFLNSFLGYERSITDHNAGTTSDFVVSDFFYKKKIIKIIDTAGIQKKSKITKNSINYLSTKKTFEMINEVQVAIILIDSSEGLNRQDKNIINIITKKPINLIIIFNKIDLIKDKKLFKKDKIDQLSNQLNQVKNIKIFFISAFKKNNTKKILEYIYTNILNKKNDIKTNSLNLWLKKAMNKKGHPLINNKKLNLKYVVQIDNNPIIIKIFCNYANKIRQDYRRYLVNDFNKYFKILNHKTIIKFSKAKNPFI